MIILLGSEHHVQDEYIVCTRESVTVAELRDRMLKRSKVVEGSYAFRLIDDLHSAIFIRSLDLKADYNTYFAVEYKSFGEYLRRRARIPSGVVTTLTQIFDESVGMYHFRPTYSFMTDTYGLGFLKRLLEDPSWEET